MAEKAKKTLSKSAARKLLNGLKHFKRDYVISQGEKVSPLELALDECIDELAKYVSA